MLLPEDGRKECQKEEAKPLKSQQEMKRAGSLEEDMPKGKEKAGLGKSRPPIGGKVGRAMDRDEDMAEGINTLTHKLPQGGIGKMSAPCLPISRKRTQVGGISLKPVPQSLGRRIPHPRPFQLGGHDLVRMAKSSRKGCIMCRRTDAKESTIAVNDAPRLCVGTVGIQIPCLSRCRRNWC